MHARGSDHGVKRRQTRILARWRDMELHQHALAGDRVAFGCIDRPDFAALHHVFQEKLLGFRQGVEIPLPEREGDRRVGARDEDRAQFGQAWPMAS